MLSYGGKTNQAGFEARPRLAVLRGDIRLACGLGTRHATQPNAPDKARKDLSRP
jgi:hypothetical protein